MFVTGYFAGTGQFGSQSIKATKSTYDTFVLRLSAVSGNYIWTKTIGGAGDEKPYDLAIATSGSIGLYVTGSFGLTKMDPATGSTLWSKATALSASESAVATDGVNVFVGGSFTGTADFDPGAGVNNLTSAGSSDAAILKLDSAGNFVWARRMGGTGFDSIGRGSIAIGAAGNVYLTGQLVGTGSFGSLTVNGINTDGFFADVDSSGAFTQATAFPDIGHGLALDSSGNVYIGGSFLALNFPAEFPTGDTLVIHGTSNRDSVLLKYSPNAPPIDPTPRVDTFLASPETVIAGEPLALNVIRVHDPEKRIQTITFYRDTGSGVLEPASDILVGGRFQFGWRLGGDGIDRRLTGGALQVFCSGQRY